MSELSAHLSPIEDIIEDARKGRMFVLVDAEDRENEGDLVIPAANAGPEAINFMAKYGRGLICLALTRQRTEDLGLELMSRQNRSRHETAFTVSIEAREGVTTGISAHDRAKTIAVAIDPEKTRYDIVTPGHVFPLVAKDGGVLVRAGHTEAAVDIARLAGKEPAGVICEIMNEDGTMARLPDLIEFARAHQLKVGTIEDLIAYRLRYDHLLTRKSESEFESEFGGKWKKIIYINEVQQSEAVALVKGDISGASPVLVRVHALRLMSDILGAKGTQTDAVRKAMTIIAEEGRGAVVILPATRENFSGDVETQPIPALTDQKYLREYGVGAQILVDLGIREMTLLSNSKTNLVGVKGYQLNVIGQRPLP